MSEAPSAEDLLARIAQQNLAAMGELYDRYAFRVFGLLMHILSSREEAEEILAQVFQRLWTESRILREEGSSVAAWLVVTARQAALDWLCIVRKGRLRPAARAEAAGGEKAIDTSSRYTKVSTSAPPAPRAATKTAGPRSGAGKSGPRGRATLAALLGVPPAWLPRPGEIELIDDRLELLHKVINQLPMSQRQALELAIFAGLSETEIAAELGEPLGKTRTGLRAAVTFVRHRRRAILGKWAANI
jgi:RNA polymerase sigma-70 factor (ECF subfamily)